jgi:hypothetical protein
MPTPSRPSRKCNTPAPGDPSSPSSLAAATPPPVAAPVVDTTSISTQPKLTNKVNYRVEEESEESSKKESLEEESEDQGGEGSNIAASTANAASVEEAEVHGGDNCGTSLAVVSFTFYLILLFSFVHRFETNLCTYSLFVTCFIICFVIIFSLNKCCRL